MKLSALYALGAVGLLLALRAFASWRRERRIPRSDVRAAVSLGLGAAIIGLAGLWLLDLRFTSFTNPVDHVRHMVTYGTGLKSPIDRTGACPGAASAPWQWLVNDCEITYLRVNTTIREGETVVARLTQIDFRGAMNAFLMAPIVLGLISALGLAVRERHRLAMWAVVWALANWLPYVLLVLASNRVTYIFYFLPIVPAAAAFLALLLWRSGLPRWVGPAYGVAYVIGFLAMFPFRQIP
jgi:hypothetical protein